MAKQTGPIKIRGCYDNVCFYKMEGKYYARKKSSLSGKRVKKDPVFKRTMENAGILGRASKMVSAVYKTMTEEERKSRSFRKITGEVMNLLREGVTEEVIVRMLRAIPEKKKGKVKRIQNREKEIMSFADEVLPRIFGTRQSHDAGLPESKANKAPPYYFTNKGWFLLPKEKDEKVPLPEKMMKRESGK